ALPSRTHVLVFAGTGFCPFHTGTHLLDSILRRIEYGTDQLREPKINILEKIIHRNRFLVPLPIRRRLWRSFHTAMELFRKKDREKRRYFGLPLEFHAGAIRINVRDREPSGRVMPGREYEMICDQISKSLLQLVNVET